MGRRIEPSSRKLSRRLRFGSLSFILQPTASRTRFFQNLKAAFHPWTEKRQQNHEGPQRIASGRRQLDCLGTLDTPGNDNGLDAVGEPVNLRGKPFCGKGVGNLIGAQQVIALHMLVEVMQRQATQRGLS